MPLLRSLVAAAKRSYVQQERPSDCIYRAPPSNLPKFIIADDAESLSTIIPQRKIKNWADCKSLKQKGEREFCMKFCSLCAKEKCSPKYMD